MCICPVPFVSIKILADLRCRSKINVPFLLCLYNLRCCMYVFILVTCLHEFTVTDCTEIVTAFLAICTRETFCYLTKELRDMNMVWWRVW